MKIKCPHCDRYLFETDNTLIVQNVKCSYCKKRFNLKVVTPQSSESEIRLKMNQNFGSEQV